MKYTFFDPDTGSEIEDIKYDISIYKDDRTQIQRLDQVSISQEFFFEAGGPYEISIDDIEDLGEGVTIPIQVTPEFQPQMFVLSAACGTGPSRASATRIVTIYLGTRSINHDNGKKYILLHCVVLAAIFSITATTPVAPAPYAQDGGMMKTTSKGTLDIRLEPVWSDGGQTTFNVRLLNPGTEAVHEHQDYDFRILKDGQQVFTRQIRQGRQFFTTLREQ